MSQAVIDELRKTVVQPFILCDIEFADQWLHLWSGIGDIDIYQNPALNIIGTAETNAGAWLLVTLDGPPANPLAIGQQYELRGTSYYATWLDGVTVTVTDVPFPYQFQANYSHSNYGQTAETGTARIPGIITYKGVGNLGSITPITETTDVQANAVTLSLSGVPSDVIAEALASCRQGLPVKLSLGFMTAGGVVIADPVVLMAGRMDAVMVDEDLQKCKISVTVESRLADLQRSRIRRFTDDDQQHSSPGDRGFQYVPLIQDWNVPWDHHRTG